MAIPSVIKNFNLFVDGIGQAGKVDEVRLPSLSIVTAEHRAGGMDAPVALDMGMQRMEMGFTLAETSRLILRQFGLISQNAVQLTFRAAKVNDEVVEPYMIAARGMYTEVGLGSIRNGDKSTIEATVSLRYFKLVLGQDTLVEIDVDNMIRSINGVDQMQAIRAAIGI